MTLQDYTTDELKAELKRRSDLAKAESMKVKRCRMCKPCKGITYQPDYITFSATQALQGRHIIARVVRPGYGTPPPNPGL